MNTLLVAFFLISATLEASLVASNGILVCLNASFVVMLDDRANVFITWARNLLLPTKWQIGGGDDLDKVHEVEGLLICVLIRTIQRINVVVRPAAWTSREMVLCHVLHNNIAQLGTES